MATGVKFQSFVEQQLINPIDWDTNTFKVALTNTAPTASTNDFFNDITEITGGGSTGYTAGGTATTITVTRSSGTAKVAGTDVVFTGGASGMGPFRYAVLYKDTGTSSTSALVAYWDYGSSISLAVGETFTVDFDATNGILQLT